MPTRLGLARKQFEIWTGHKSLDPLAHTVRLAAVLPPSGDRARFTLSSLTATMLALIVWFAVALGIASILFEIQ